MCAKKFGSFDCSTRIQRMVLAFTNQWVYIRFFISFSRKCLPRMAKTIDQNSNSTLCRDYFGMHVQACGDARRMHLHVSLYTNICCACLFPNFHCTASITMLFINSTNIGSRESVSKTKSCCQAVQLFQARRTAAPSRAQCCAPFDCHR